MPSAIPESAETPRQARKPGIIDWVSYLCVRGLEGLTGLLPLPVCARVGAIAGVLFFACAPPYRKLAARNLSIAFGREMDASQRRKLLWRHAARIGANLMCSLRFNTMTAAQIDACVEIEPRPHMPRRYLEGSPIVVIVSHLGPWELLAQTRCFLPPEMKNAAIYQPLANPLLDRHVLRRRQQKGCHLISRAEGFSEALEWLRAGGTLGVLSDQHAGDAGVFTPYCGRLASTTHLPLLLARRSKAAVYVLGVQTLAPGKWRFTFDPLPLSSVGTPPEADLHKLNLAIESAMRRSPEDAFWEHNRWKTPDPAFLLRHHKRGIHLPNEARASLQPFRMVLRSPNWLGDACMAVPAVRAIKNGRPDAFVAMLTPAKFADFWRAVPEVDEIIVRESGDGVFAVGRKLRASGPWDVGILFPNSPRSALEMRIGGVCRVVGYGAKRGWLVDQAIPRMKPNGPRRHHIETYLQIAHRIGADCEAPGLFDPLPSTITENPTDKNPAIRIGICFGAEYGPAKRWPVERFAETAKLVAEQHPQPIRWQLLGVAAEAALAEKLSGMLGDLPHDNLVGKTTLAGLIKTLRQSRLLLSNDTGTMHLAALLGTPVVAIFGSTEPSWTRPMGRQHTILREHVECSPCFLRECPIDFRCMTSIQPARAATAIIEQIKR